MTTSIPLQVWNVSIISKHSNFCNTLVRPEQSGACDAPLSAKGQRPRTNQGISMNSAKISLDFFTQRVYNSV